jgi:hypothetical protein
LLAVATIPKLFADLFIGWLVFMVIMFVIMVTIAMYYLTK